MAVATKAPKAPKAPKGVKSSFPTRYVNKWVREHEVWNHDDWLFLLSKLAETGYADWTKKDQNKDVLGAYLESYRDYLQSK